jgi:hypothetical protein
MKVLAGRSTEVSQYVEDVKSVIIYAKNGVIEVLPGHQNLYTTLSNNIIDVIRNSEDAKITFVVFKGVVNVTNKKESNNNNTEVIFLSEDFIKIDKDTSPYQIDILTTEVQKITTKLNELKLLFDSEDFQSDDRMKEELNDSFLYYTKRLEFIQLAITTTQKKFNK